MSGAGGRIEVASRSVGETQALAARLQALLEPGDVILLGGELGAGKTAFVQGLARAMGIEGPVTSPTFTLVRSYDGAGGVRLLHADVYRLDHLQEIVDLGLPELLDEGALAGVVAAIEWGEAAAPVLASDYLEIRIGFGAGDDDRVLSLTPVGARWAAPGRVRSLCDLRDLHPCDLVDLVEDAAVEDAAVEDAAVEVVELRAVEDAAVEDAAVELRAVEDAAS
jgi:tRNA threonylcarbamoyladenosine biosynthesis protein TsaE